MIPSNQDDVVYRRRRLPSRHVEDEENKYDADDEWATEATRLLENHYDNEERHEIVDLLIDCMQTLYAGINQRIAQVKPHRKAYSFFFSEKQPMVAKVHKIRGHAEKFQIAKKVAKWWTILSPEEKAVYLTAEHTDRLAVGIEIDQVLLDLAADDVDAGGGLDARIELTLLGAIMHVEHAALAWRLLGEGAHRIDHVGRYRR